VFGNFFGFLMLTWVLVTRATLLGCIKAIVNSPMILGFRPEDALAPLQSIPTNSDCVVILFGYYHMY